MKKIDHIIVELRMYLTGRRRRIIMCLPLMNKYFQEKLMEIKLQVFYNISNIKSLELDVTAVINFKKNY